MSKKLVPGTPVRLRWSRHRGVIVPDTEPVAGRVLVYIEHIGHVRLPKKNVKRVKGV